MAGKMSYMKTCQEKFKRLDNSPLGEALRQRTGLSPQLCVLVPSPHFKEKKIPKQAHNRIVWFSYLVQKAPRQSWVILTVRAMAPCSSQERRHLPPQNLDMALIQKHPLPRGHQMTLMYQVTLVNACQAIITFTLYLDDWFILFPSRDE